MLCRGVGAGGISGGIRISPASQGLGLFLLEGSGRENSHRHGSSGWPRRLAPGRR